MRLIFFILLILFSNLSESKKKINYLLNSTFNNLTYYVEERCDFWQDIFPNVNRTYHSNFRVDNPVNATFILGNRQCLLNLVKNESSLKKIFAKRNVFLTDMRDLPISNRLLIGSKNHLILANCRNENIIFRNDKKFIQSGFRSYYDVCAPLPPKYISNTITTSITSNNNDNAVLFDSPKAYLLTLKGTVYTGNFGMFRFMLSHLHDPSRGIIIMLSCNHPTNNRQISRIKNSTLKANCDKLAENEYNNKLSYGDSLNSIFVLAPAGRQPASYRFMEAMHIGAIPIPFYERADAAVPLPYSNIIDWSECTQVITSLFEIDSIIHQRKSVIRKRQAACQLIYDTHFSSIEKYEQTLLLSMLAKLKKQFHKVFV
jgi:hypothetical protein